MRERVFVCNKWPSLSVRNLRFVGGKFVAKTKEEAKIIEASDSYGVHIWPQDAEPEPVASDEETQALAAVSAALAEPQIHQGRRGSRF